MAVAGLKMLFSNAKKWASAVTSGQFIRTVNQSADWSVLPLFLNFPVYQMRPFLASTDAVIEVTRQLAEMGCGGAVCFASGFAESGDIDLQQQLVTAAGDMPLLGPNCYGFINYLDGALLWPDQHCGRRCDTGVALISQSSNIAINLGMQARGLPIGCVACVGNQAQTSLTDITAALLDDPRINVAGLYIEGIDDAPNLPDWPIKPGKMANILSPSNLAKQRYHNRRLARIPRPLLAMLPPRLPFYSNAALSRCPALMFSLRP